MTDGKLDLEITRLIAARREKVWRCWSDPELLRQWWCPRPWTTELRGFDFRSGGAFHPLMRGPDGGTSDNPGLFLEIVPQTRIVWTTMLTEGWRPAQPWLPMTGIFTLADEGDATRYTARCLHRDHADCAKHEDMGFFDGWGAAIGQLAELAEQG